MSLHNYDSSANVIQSDAQRLHRFVFFTLIIKALVELDKCLNENMKKVAKANVSL